MPVVAVVNRKGGSGKSTLSTNIAGWCAANGWRVMLGDVDRQQSVRSWLSRRSQRAAPVTTWALDNGKVFRAPPGTTHVVLDTPGALYDHELAKLIVWVDAVIVPIGPSVFDQDASTQFMDELARHPKVRSGRCKVTAIGMRWPHERLEQWSQGLGHQDVALLTVIPDAPKYRRLLETGSSLFDDTGGAHSADQAHWQPLMDWLEQVWHPADLTRSPGAKPQRSVMNVNSTSSALAQRQPPPNSYRAEELAENATRLRVPCAVHSGNLMQDAKAPRAVPIPAYLLKSHRAGDALEPDARHSKGDAVVHGAGRNAPETLKAAGQTNHLPIGSVPTCPVQTIESRSQATKGWLQRVFKRR